MPEPDEEEEDASEDTQEEAGSSEDVGRSGDGAGEADWEDVDGFRPYGEAMQDGLLEDEEGEEEGADAVDATDAQEPIRRAAPLKVFLGIMLLRLIRWPLCMHVMAKGGGLSCVCARHGIPTSLHNNGT